MIRNSFFKALSNNKLGVFALLLVATLPATPDFLTRYFPVNDKLTITAAVKAPDPIGTILSGYALKYRNCSFKFVKWYLGHRNGLSVPVGEAEFRDPPRINGVGLMTWDSIYVPLDLVVIRHTSYADVFHLCPWLSFEWPLWLVEGEPYTDEDGKTQIRQKRFILKGIDGAPLTYLMRTQYHN